MPKFRITVRKTVHYHTTADIEVEAVDQELAEDEALKIAEGENETIEWGDEDSTTGDAFPYEIDDVEEIEDEDDEVYDGELPL